MRGTEFFSDYSIQNTVLEDTEIHLGSEDLNTEDVTPIVTQGSYGSRATHLPVYYNKNRLVSNVANVRFGDSYGKGNRHIFTSCTFEKTGNNPNYHTFVFDGGYDSQDHEVIDPVFVGGARFDDVYWKQTSVMSYYTVKYSLTIQGAANAPVTVYDKNGAVVFNDKIQSNGQVRVPLSYATIRPVEWTPSSTGGGVKNLGSHQKQLHTPHKVKVGGSEKSVTMDAQKTLMF